MSELPLTTWLDRPLPAWSRFLALGADDPRLVDLLAFLAAVAALGGVHAATTLGLVTPFAPYSGQEVGQSTPLLARSALLLLAFAGPRRLPLAALATAGALFTLSLAFRAFTLPAIVVTVALLRARRSTDRPSPLPAWVVAAAVALTAVALVPHAAAAAPAPPTAPDAAYRYWLGRKNVRRAHAAALAWAKTETPPREGYLALAKVDLAMDDRDRARKVLRKLIDHTDRDDLRAEATALEATIHE